MTIRRFLTMMTVALAALSSMNCSRSRNNCIPSYLLLDGVRDAYGADVSFAIVGCSDALAALSSQNIYLMETLLQRRLRENPSNSRSSYLDLEFRNQACRDVNSHLGRVVATDVFVVTYFAHDVTLESDEDGGLERQMGNAASPNLGVSADRDPRDRGSRPLNTDR